MYVPICIQQIQDADLRVWLLQKWAACRRWPVLGVPSLPVGTLGNLGLIGGGRGRQGVQVRFALGAGGFFGDDAPARGAGQELADKLGVKCVAGLMGLDAAKER